MNEREAECSNANIYFFYQLRLYLVVYYGAIWRTFKPKLEKQKKKHPEKIYYLFSKNAFLIFRETELSYILLKKLLLYFQKWNFLALSIKNFREELPS